MYIFHLIFHLSNGHKLRAARLPHAGCKIIDIESFQSFIIRYPSVEISSLP